ncbi:MAG: BadF/BadG/BcrA/BcrD ATPase family protein [Cyanobacteriota bacterium]|nr:BadF/BadG/BcrA/BcrD ATPase family protein [Cyanobacteriota bacterium]
MNRPIAAGLNHQVLIAGFDAGQTHTTCRLARLGPTGTWRNLAEGEGSGVSHLAAPGGESRFRDALRSSLQAALHGPEAAQTLAGGAVAAAAVGASGIEQGSPVQQRGLALAAETLGLPPERVAVTGDERSALRGALGDQPGVLVISGTGCIAVGQTGEGRQHRCGGWGWLLDGAGSAMDIGRDGLAASVRMADGRIPESPLRGALWQAIGATTAQEVKAAVVASGFGPAHFARLAPLVAAAAATGDQEAIAIVQRSALALAELVAGVARALDLQAPCVCAVGGAVEHLKPLGDGLQSALTARVPGARLQQPLGDGCDGALAMAAARAPSP